MIICTQCGKENLEGALICSECYYFLVTDAPTPRLIRTSELLKPYRLQNTPKEYRLILNPSRLFQVKSELPNGRLVLGRADQDAQVTLPNSANLGVSRIHAAILPQSEGLAVQDLGSTNGTYLNGDKLVANRAYWLAHGDILCLGEFALRVYLEN